MADAEHTKRLMQMLVQAISCYKRMRGGATGHALPQLTKADRRLSDGGFVCLYAFMYISVYVYIYTYAYVHIFVHITHIDRYMYVAICMWLYVYTCIFI